MPELIEIINETSVWVIDAPPYLEIPQEVVTFETTETVIIDGAEQGARGPAGAVGPGMTWRGGYSDSTAYVENDAATFAGSSWRALRSVMAVSPVEGADWTLVAQRGADGTPGTDATYIHNQGAAAAVWTIVHNLGKYPSVMVVDSGDHVVQGEIAYLDLNTVELAFSAPFGGKAYLN